MERETCIFYSSILNSRIKEIKNIMFFLQGARSLCLAHEEDRNLCDRSWADQPIMMSSMQKLW